MGELCHQAPGEFRAVGVALRQQRESQRQQGVAGEQGSRFVESLVARWPASPEVGVIHAR